MTRLPVLVSSTGILAHQAKAGNWARNGTIEALPAQVTTSQTWAIMRSISSR